MSAIRRSTARRLSHEVLYDGRIFRIDRDLIRLSTGRSVAMEIVRHRGSVVLVPQPAPGRVILIRQYRYAINRWIWELPAGSLEPDERPAAAARRECAEEIGLTPARVSRIGTYFPTPGFCDERMVFYLCRDLAPPRRPVARDEDEQIEPKTFAISHVWRMVDRGEVIDMKTVLGLLLLERRQGPGRTGRLTPISARAQR
jgi:ADP-ribose diphosphatase